MHKEHRMIVAVAPPERIKVVRFLLNLARWQVVDCPQVADAVNLIRNNALNGRCYEALVLFDYASMAANRNELLQQAQCLRLCAELEPGLPIIVADNNITAQERELLLEVLGTEIEFCNVEYLVSRLEQLCENNASRTMT